MASQQNPTSVESLPGDLLSNIFLRLLAKQLAQMRCVSKPWNALLSQKTFVKSHLDHSIHKNDEILLLFYSPTEPFSVHPSRSPDLELSNFIKLPVNLPSEGAVVGRSVNGLICLYYGSDSSYAIHIWNPSLSAVTTLPPYSMPSLGYDRMKFLFQFGFDPKSDDYKVVKLASVLQSPSEMDPKLVHYLAARFLVAKEWLPVEVYSMRKGSWQLITQRFPSNATMFFDQDEVCVDGLDGFLHWHDFIDEKKELQKIVGFDLNVETFHEIPLPDSILDHNVCDRCNFLGVLGGKLCVMSCIPDDKCEVWVMDAYGVIESWAKHHVFSQFSGDILPYGFTLHNKFILQLGGDGLALFDPIASTLKIFKTPGLWVSQVVGYVDSLVWVEPSELGQKGYKSQHIRSSTF